MDEELRILIIKAAIQRQITAYGKLVEFCNQTGLKSGESIEQNIVGLKEALEIIDATYN